MPKHIQKSLQDCLSKLKIPNKQIQFPLTGCKHAKTTSFISGGKAKVDDGVTLSDIDKFLFENFKSLYPECEGAISKRPTAFLEESPQFLEPPRLKNLCRSGRFFVESGSSSSRITDEQFSASSSPSSSAVNETSTASEEPEAEVEDASVAPEDFIALLTYSPSPYNDFRRSMQEMVEVRLGNNGKVDWAFLEELLFCYMELNNKKSYRYILRAFVDIIVVLRESSGKSPANPPPFKGGGRTSQPK